MGGQTLHNSSFGNVPHGLLRGQVQHNEPATIKNGDARHAANLRWQTSDSCLPCSMQTGSPTASIKTAICHLNKTAIARA